MVNSFLLHVFDLDAATFVAVIYGKSFCFGCFRWARPLSSCCFVALETKRKSGWGICGSSWCGLFAVLFVLWFAIWWYQPIVLFTAFSLLMSLLGPCHRAFTAKLEEKKKTFSFKWSNVLHQGPKIGPSAGWIRCLLEGPVLSPPMHLLQLRCSNVETHQRHTNQHRVANKGLEQFKIPAAAVAGQISFHLK